MARGAIGPRMTTAGIVDRISAARVARSPLRISGAGTWLDAGRPCSASEPLQSDAGIVSYEPGDLTITARAGTPIADLQRVTGAEGLWLTLDPHGSPHGTLGAAIATGSWGPLATAFGTPRDHVLGCEFVTGAGDIVNAGGRVVKNVAGFDLVRLATGSWGTIGMLTELTVRLRARPEEDVTLAIAVRSIDDVGHWLRTTPHSPLAAEFLSSSLAMRLIGAQEPTLLLRFGGNSGLVLGARLDAEQLGPATDAGTGVWPLLATCEPSEAIVFRLSTLPSRIASLWTRAVGLTETFAGFAHATPVRGVVRCILPACSDSDLPHLVAALTALTTDVTMVGERLNPELWPLASRVRTTDALSAGVRRAFDPDGILNPGILGPA